MQLEQVPLQTLCLGCKRYFILHQKLPLESMTVEFKNYSFPIRESYLKQILLKTIVGFMNSKGGTIFMGVNDSNGEVEGVSLGRKEMDQFRLMIKQMLEKVQPTVDLVKSEEVSVDFTPVLEGRQRAFYGKYVIKFIILQGDPSKFYCISEKVRVSGNRIDEVEVISAFRRHNLGGVEEIKGINVIHEIYEKARNPYKTARTFHQNCNPPPISPMILERPKPEKTPHIFATDDEKENGQAQNQSEQSQNDTIINKIKDIQEPVHHQQNKFRVQPETGNFVYFENVKVDCVKSFINFLRNSTTAKTSKEIVQQNGIVKVVCVSNSQKECLIEQFSKASMRRLMNSFGVNDKVNILNSLMLNNHIVMKQSPQIAKTTPSHTNSYILLFHGYDSGTQSSIQNYLQKCLTSNICRKMKRSREGLELIFGVKKDMNVFYTMCNKPPHSRQLNQFWSTGTVKLKMYIREENSNEGKLLGEIKKEKQVKVINEEKQFPSLLSGEIKLEAENQSTQHKSLQLIASSLQPAEVSKLSNYLINSMFYNIQKKILASKERFYIRLVFNQPSDTTKFLKLCLLEQHKNLLAQFTASKTMRIGFPGDSLLLYPYTENLKEELKKVVLKVLGQGAIKKSVVKELGEDQKVWSLNLVDNSKLLESYQKLEAFLRKQGFFINQEWVRFKVFLDYKNLTQ